MREGALEFLATFVTIVVALEHVWFLVLEMFLWTKPLGMRTFRLERQFAERSRALAMNQGLYNGFLAAGLAWSLVTSADLGAPVRLFFLVCVVVAGIFGALTVSRAIFFVQAVPALLALALSSLAR